MAVALDDFAKYVRPHVLGCPDPLLKDTVLRVCIDFCTRTEILAESVTVTLVTDTETYTFAASADLYPARIREALYDELPLEPWSREVWFSSLERFESNPPEYFFAPSRTQVTFAPVPNADDDTVELDVIVRPTDTATTVPDRLFLEWATAIADGVKAELMLMAGVPWANPNLGAYFKGRYDWVVATAAVQETTGNVGGPMRIAPLPI